MLLWDAWGLMDTPFEQMRQEEIKALDRVAEQLGQGDIAWVETRTSFHEPWFHVPSEITVLSPFGAPPRRIRLEH